MYDTLTPYQQSCITATNFWRIVNGLEPIEVPRLNTEHWDRWENENMEAKALAAQKEINRKLQHEKTTIPNL